jgi:hypothetical protein
MLKKFIRQSTEKSEFFQNFSEKKETLKKLGEAMKDITVCQESAYPARD